MSDSGLRRRFAFLLGAVVLVFGYAVGGYMLLGFGVIDSIYMSALALTTAGFNPAAPLGTAAKAFTVSVAVLGVTIFLAALTTLGQAVAEGRLLSRRKRMQRRIDKMSDHYIVCAYGRVGRTVAREFEAEGVDFIVIDKDETLEEQMSRDGVTYLIGDPASEPMLKAAGIERARGLVCAMDSDAENVYITLAARTMNPGMFIVARAAEEVSADRLYRAGADRVISPYVTSGRHMAMSALRPRVIDYFYIGHREPSDLRLEEVQLETGSQLAGRPIGDVVGKAIALAVRRADGQVVAGPEPSMTLEEGDLLVMLGEAEQLRTLEQ